MKTGDHGAQNMGLLRQIAHNLLKRETSLKTGIQSLPPRPRPGGKRLNAGWSEDYLLKVLLS